MSQFGKYEYVSDIMEEEKGTWSQVFQSNFLIFRRTRKNA